MQKSRIAVLPEMQFVLVSVPFVGTVLFVPFVPLSALSRRILSVWQQAATVLPPHTGAARSYMKAASAKAKAMSARTRDLNSMLAVE